jgi:exodeoxyribonuclease-3
MKHLLLFFALAVPLTGISQKPITYLSYNILEGFKNDSTLKAGFVSWVKDINPDIAAFQETNKFTQKTLEEFAARYDHHYAVLCKEPGYPVALTSKYPIVNVQKVLDNMWHGYIYANVLDYHIFVLHLSPHNQEKRNREIAQIIAHAKLLPSGAKIIFSGDFNAVSETDKARYTDTLVRSMQEREEKEAHIRNLKNGQIDYDVIGQMKKAGYTDAFHKMNKTFKHSIPTREYASETAFGRRIDFVFTSQNLAGKIASADIIHDRYTDYLSDHYPVVVRFLP